MDLHWCCYTYPSVPGTGVYILVLLLYCSDLWKLVSFAPCKAHDTVYTTSMVPRTGELVTRVYPTRKQRAAGKKKFKGVQVGSSGGGGATRQ